MGKGPNRKTMGRVMPTISTPPKESVEGNIGKTHQGQYIPQRVEDLNVTGNLVDGIYLRYSLSLRKWEYVPVSGSGEANTASNIGTGVGLYDSKVLENLRFKSLLAGTGINVAINGDDVEIINTVSQLTAAEVISMIENAASITLNNLEVTGGTILNDLSFSTGAIIDYTNSTSTGVQNFDSSYIANYNGSTINNTNVTTSYTGGSVSYNDSTTINLSENTFINGQTLATQADIAGMSNWKVTAVVATTAASDLTGYVYVPANEPTGEVWTSVNAAPTIDGVTLTDQDRLLIKDSTDAKGNGLFIYDAATSSFIRTSDANNDPSQGEVASMMVGVYDGTTNNGKIFREIHTNPITLGTDTVEFTPFIINVAAGEVNTSSNSGTGIGLALAKVGVDLPFKSLLAGTHVTVVDNGLDITINSIQLTSAEVIAMIEGATTLDLTNVDVILGDVLNTGTTTYSNTAIIDYTNSTSTGVQNYNNSYTANYNGSTINTTNVTQNNDGGTVNNTNQTINNDGDTEINNNGSTINNTNITENVDGGTTNVTNSHVTNYDSTTTVNMEGDTNIENLDVTNITIAGGGSIAVDGSWIRQNESTLGATEMVLSNTPISGEAGLFVFKQDSGLHWTSITDYTYDIPTKTITFSALTAGDIIEVRYMVATSSTGTAFLRDDFTGVTNTITLTQEPIDEDAVRVVTDSGTELIQGVDWDWTTTIGAKEITFNPVLSSEDIYVYYPYGFTMSDYVSDEVYGATWDGITQVAPSKNAVYDKIEEIEGQITTAPGAFVGGSKAMSFGGYYPRGNIIGTDYGVYPSRDLNNDRLVLVDKLGRKLSGVQGQISVYSQTGYATSIVNGILYMRYTDNHIYSIDISTPPVSINTIANWTDVFDASACNGNFIGHNGTNFVFLHTNTIYEYDSTGTLVRSTTGQVLNPGVDMILLSDNNTDFVSANINGGEFTIRKGQYGTAAAAAAISAMDEINTGGDFQAHIVIGKEVYITQGSNTYIHVYNL